MGVELVRPDTRVVLGDAPWERGIRRLVVRRGTGGAEAEIPFLAGAVAGHHFFTGAWPPPAGAVDFEPQVSPGTLVRVGADRAVWHRPPTPHTRVETRVEYALTGPGEVEARFETRSHAAAYPYGYVGLFWATIVPPGGQRGVHVVLPAAAGRPRWHYFQGGGDNLAPRANTLLGPGVAPAAHAPGHPPAYFLAEAAPRLALPLLVGRWGDLGYTLEVDTPEVALTDVLLATAVGGPSWDVSWRLRPGETRRVRCRLTVGPWGGWAAVETRHREWAGGDPASSTAGGHGSGRGPVLAPPSASPAGAGAGLALSERLFEARGRPLLEGLGLLDRCAVACVGGASQNAGLDDPLSRDHWWGPYLTFLLDGADWAAHHGRLESAVAAMPDEADGVVWIGYGGPAPRRTACRETEAFLRELTGLERRPETDREWLPHLTRAAFLGTRWTERLSDAGQGRVLHDPGKRFTERWRHWTGYVPPDVHRALLARALFRVWNAGPEHNLRRAVVRGDDLAFAQCLARFVDEVLDLAFGWNERFVPPPKWRAAHFRRLPLSPVAVQEGLEALCRPGPPGAPARALETAQTVVGAIKALTRDLYHLTADPADPLSAFAREVHRSIADDAVRAAASLDW